MSYTRGKIHTFASLPNWMEIWQADKNGFVRHYECGWVDYWKKEVGGKKNLGKVVLPQDFFDELVVMRYAELKKERKLTKTKRRAIKKWGGNGGCMALRREE